jgi:eukaryotic-like serine/threonine-protein kinase
VPGSIPTPFPPLGERYGRFVLLERIGRGGMAEVYRAVAQGVEGFQRVFVVKRIQREQADNPQIVEMFANEARISALLNHPNIVQVFDFGQLDGSYFISMEYLRGKDLLAVLRQLRAASRFMTPVMAAAIAREVASGLAYAHSLVAPGGKSLDIIHRDVSPSNIMLLRAGGVKLLDFGIAKASAAIMESGRGHVTGTGMLKGKLSYLSPEQVRHEPVDARTDIFSLGVVLWECLTGKRLFHDRSDYHTMNNVLTRAVPAPSTQQPDVPPMLDAIVLRALDRDKTKRTQTAKTLADELDQFLAKHPLPAGALPQLLDDLFGENGHELEAIPAVGSGPLAADAETPVMTAVMLPTIPSVTAITAVPNRSDGLLPASSPSGPHDDPRSSARHWPWVAGSVLVVAAFAAGRLVRPAAPPPTAQPAPAAVVEPLVPRNPVSAPSPAPAPSAATTIAVRIESDPPGAEVVGNDGARLGTTPLATTLPQGGPSVAFTISKAGFLPHRQVIFPDRDLYAVVNLRPDAAATPPPVKNVVAKTTRAKAPAPRPAAPAPATETPATATSPATPASAASPEPNKDKEAAATSAPEPAKPGASEPPPTTPPPTTGEAAPPTPATP